MSRKSIHKCDLIEKEKKTSKILYEFSSKKRALVEFVIIGGCLDHMSRLELSENPGIALMLGQADCGCR